MAITAAGLASVPRDEDVSLPAREEFAGSVVFASPPVSAANPFAPSPSSPVFSTAGGISLDSEPAVGPTWSSDGGAGIAFGAGVSAAGTAATTGWTAALGAGSGDLGGIFSGSLF